MNFIERKVIKHYWGRAMKIENFRRWLPLLSVAFLCARIITKALGYNEIDTWLASVGSLLGVESFSPVDFAELSAAFVAAAGVGLKIRNSVKTAMPPSVGTDMKAGALTGAVVLMLCSPVSAQEATPTPTPTGDAMTWLSAHSAIISGTYSTDTSDREEFIGLRISGDFNLAPKLTGWATVDLFTRSRDGQSATPALPSSPAGLAVYSSGEMRVGAYRTLTGLLSAECIAGATFPMPSLGGPSVDPLDGVKILGGCGLRVGTRDTWARAVAGHFGPVVDGGVLAGFVPSLSLSARVPIRDHLALAPELSIGRNTLAQKTTYAARVAFVAF